MELGALCPTTESESLRDSGIKRIGREDQTADYIAIKASNGDVMAVNAHVPMAKELGATKAEVVDAILMTLTVSGIRGVVSCLPEVVKHFED